MHQVLLGVGRTLLFVIRKKLGHNVAAVNTLVGQIKLPNDFKRKARPLSELDYFKANEVKVWLLYVWHIVLHHQVCQDLYDRFYLLGFITRQVLCSRIFATEAEALIQFFLKKTEEAHGHEVFFGKCALSEIPFVASGTVWSLVVHFGNDVWVCQLFVENKVHGNS